MIVIKYNKKHHADIVKIGVSALRAGKIVVYPTETLYGLACDPKNAKAVRRLYAMKQRSFRQPIHLIVPTIAAGKRLVVWNRIAGVLAKKFWPGSLTIVLPLKSTSASIKQFSAGTGTLGLRMPSHPIPSDLARGLGRPIPATSANLGRQAVGGFDSYSVDDVIKQFRNKKYRPDIIIDAGELSHREPSTMALVEDDIITVLRQGPVSLKQIAEALT